MLSGATKDTTADVDVSCASGTPTEVTCLGPLRARRCRRRRLCHHSRGWHSPSNIGWLYESPSYSATATSSAQWPDSHRHSSLRYWSPRCKFAVRERLPEQDATSIGRRASVLGQALRPGRKVKEIVRDFHPFDVRIEEPRRQPLPVLPTMVL
jgi:hypothetical protein